MDKMPLQKVSYSSFQALLFIVMIWQMKNSTNNNQE